MHTRARMYAPKGIIIVHGRVHANKKAHAALLSSTHVCTLRTPPSRPITHCVHMCTHRACTACTACTFARSCVRIRTQLRAFLHAARVFGTVLAVHNLDPQSRCLRPRIKQAACMRTQRARSARGSACTFSVKKTESVRKICMQRLQMCKM